MQHTHPHPPWPPATPGRIVAVMLMQGDDMLLAFFEVCPPSSSSSSASTAKGRFCVPGPLAPRRNNTCYQACMQEALMSCVVVLTPRPGTPFKEVPHVMLERGLGVRKLIFLKITRIWVYFAAFARVSCSCCFFWWGVNRKFFFFESTV